MGRYNLSGDGQSQSGSALLRRPRAVQPVKLFENHGQLLDVYKRQLQKGMDYVQSHTPEEIAQVIAPQFAETDLADITTIVIRYYEQDTWKDNLIFEEKSFELLQDILAEAEELESRVPYDCLLYTSRCV